MLPSQDSLIPHAAYHSQYRILGQIGQGQFGRVYCAIHRHSGRLYALKDLEHRVFPTNKFLRELTYLVTLRHPHIVACHALEYHPGGRYLVMDYCEGGTLRDLVEGEGEWVLKSKLKLITEVLWGLDHAHRANVIHCDIKPDNILLVSAADGWRAKISDFGIARLTEITGNPNYGKGYTGSPAYMAPERFYGKFSVASDLYAVGVLLYELICRDRPFSGLPGELQSAHLNRRLQFPSNFPARLRPIISRALEKLPQKRFTSASEMALVLEKEMLALSPVKPSQSFFFLPSLALTSPTIHVIQTDALAFQVNHLAIHEQRVYLGMGNQLALRSYERRDLGGKYQTCWDSYFNIPIVSLHLREAGIAVFTQEVSQNKTSPLFRYSLHLLSDKQTSRTILPTPKTSWIAQQFIYTFDPNGQWLAMVNKQSALTPKGTFQLLNTQNWQPIAPPNETRFPSQLLTIDHRHGLAVCLAQTETRKASIFRLFNRRGQLMRAFALPLLLTNLCLNPYSRNHLFGLDLTHRSHGFLIRLQPFKVSRLALALEPQFILPYPWGYLLAHHQGKLILLDNEGYHIEAFDLAEPITAIAAVGRFRCLVATWQNHRGNLHLLDLGDEIESFIEQYRMQKDE